MKSILQQANHQSLLILNTILNNSQNRDEIFKTLNSLNGNTLFKLFEYYSCQLNNLIPWDLLPFEIKEQLSSKHFIVISVSMEFLMIY